MSRLDRQTNLRHILEARASAAMEGVDLLPEIRNRTRQTRSWSRLVPTNRLARVTVTGLALIFVVGAAYMGSSVVTALLDFEWSQIENEGLVQEIGLTRTVGDVTVELERGYADQNFVILGMTISGPEQRYAFGSPVVGESVPLLTSDGIAVPLATGMGTDPWGSVRGDWQPTQRLAEVAAYDASAVLSQSGELGLRVETYVVDQADTVVGPFVFEFVLPVVPGELIQVGETAQAPGPQITLDRVVVTRSATRAFLEFPPRSGLPLPVVSGISVSIELPSGKTATESFSQSVFNDDGSLRAFVWNVTRDFTNEHGEWELRVIFNDNTEESAVFTFEVP